MTQVIRAGCEAHAALELLASSKSRGRHDAQRRPIAVHVIVRRIAVLLPCSTAMLCMSGFGRGVGSAKPATRPRIHLAVRPI
jgi:hypothetical protein